MLMNGHHLVSGLLKPIELLISWIESTKMPYPFKVTLRGWVGLIPAIVVSLFLPAIAPLSVCIAIIIIYVAFKPIQEKLWLLKPADRYFMVCIPAYLTYLIWASILWKLGNLEQISRTIGPMIIMSTVAVWPIYLSFKKGQPEKSKMSFKTVYFICAAFVLIQQLLLILGSIFQ